MAASWSNAVWQMRASTRAAMAIAPDDEFETVSIRNESPPFNAQTMQSQTEMIQEANSKRHKIQKSSRELTCFSSPCNAHDTYCHLSYHSDPWVCSRAPSPRRVVHGGNIGLSRPSRTPARKMMAPFFAEFFDGCAKLVGRSEI